MAKVPGCLTQRQPVLNARRGVEATLRSDGLNNWLFILNCADEEVQVQLPADSTDLISGSPLNTSLQLGPQGIAIVQLAKLEKKKNP